MGIFLTWPLVTKLDAALLGGYGDTRGNIWGVWTGLRELWGLNPTGIIAAPFHSEPSIVVHQPVLEQIQFFLAKNFGEVAGNNLVILLAFPLTAFATFLFLHFFLRRKDAAFVGGLIFGFCPAAVMQTVGGHLVFAFNIFLPLFLMSLFYNREKRSLLSAFSVGLCYALLALTSLYVGYFSIYVALLFFGFDLFTRREGAGRKRLLMSYALSVVFAGLFLLPFYWKIIMHLLVSSTSELVIMGHVRSYAELFAYSARPLEFFLPSIDHPFFGENILNFVRNYLHGGNVPEQTLYFGFVPMFICLTGFFLWTRNGAGDRKNLFLFFVAGVLILVFLSAPPAISFGTLRVPTLSYFAYKIAPMFRVYARFGILANFFMACAVAVVLTELSRRMRRGRYCFLLAIVFPLLIFEYWSISPRQVRAVDKPPPVYQWLAEQPGDFIIAEYPMMKSHDLSFYTYLFWQRIHQKRMVNGAAPGNNEAWDFYQKVKDLSDPKTLRLLKSVGVKYVIIHKEMYREGVIPGPIKRYFPPEVSAHQYNDGEVHDSPCLGEPVQKFMSDRVYLL